jgi:glycosyltransferase involved in cell wall biosynthesis
MIAHHFPPAAGSGSIRALAFTRYLPEHGWRPTVLTPGAAWASPRDDALALQIPSDVRVVRTRSWEPRPRPPTASAAAPSHATRPSAVRSQLGHLKRFPDAHIGWLPFALGAARRLPLDVAYSTSGPFTSHLVGLLLKKAARKPWVAELRDGWYRWNRAIFPDYPAWRDVLERRLEAAALRLADRVVLVTERMANAFRCQYPDLPPAHFRVVSNGFDPAQLTGTAEPANDSTRFTLVHSGALYYGRSLSAFLEAARLLSERNPAFGERFELRLLGSLDGGARAEIEASPLRGHVRFVGQVSHAESLGAMRSASALLLVSNTTPGAEATVPGKLFEYLAVGRPVLAVAPAESSTADVLRHTGGGQVVASDDVAAIAAGLEAAFGGALPPATSGVERFSRRALTADLAAIFDELV